MTDTHFEPTYTLGSHDTVRRRPWFSLRKLLVVLVLMAAAPLLVIEVTSSQWEQDERVQRAQESTDALAEVIASSNERRLEGVGQLLLAIAESPGVGSAERTACSSYLRRLRSLQPSYLNLGLISPEGRLLCDALGSAPGVDLADRTYFKDALKQGKLTVGEFQVGRLTGQRSVVVAHPVVGSGGAIRGVVYAALDVNALSDSLKGAGAVTGASVQLVDRAAVVLASSELQGNPVGQPLADMVSREAVRTQRTGRLEVQGGDGPALLRTLHPVKLRDEGVWFVTVTVPVNQIIAPELRKLQLRMAAILAVALGAAVAVWFAGSRFVVRPVENLIRSLRYVEGGDYARAQRQPRNALRELDDLQHSLTHLVLGLDAQRYERDQALGALSEREARYRELFKANPQVMYVHDVRSLQFLAVNEAASAFYGYSREEFLDMTLPDIWPVWERAERLGTFARRRPGEMAPASRVWTHQRKDGSTRQVKVLVSPTVFEGFPAELVMVTDVTDQLATEARVRESSELLEQRVAERTRELQLANRELEAFSYSVSHDLRNPLGAVRMFGQMLAAHLGDTVDAQGHLYLARIEQGVSGMERLIDDLMALAQVTRTELLVVNVDLTAICRDVLKDLRETDPQRRVEVTLEEGLECAGDTGLLGRMMSNLIGNAWKFSAGTREARIHIGRQTGVAADSPPVFFVQDNGAGFDMQFADRLFLPFERLHGDQDFPGNGVGLATVQRIVARHGGRIWAEAGVNQGATFRFIINPSRAG